MARNEMPDQEMEQRLREHFSEEARELQAPDDLWARLEGRLGKQQPPRFAFLRGGAAAIGATPWIPAAAAAVLVVGLGIGAWALAGGPGDSGGDDDDSAAPAAVAASSRSEAEPVAEQQVAATEAAATEAAAAEAAAEEAPAQEAATAAARAAATPTPAQAAAAQAATATEAPAATEAAAATQAAAATEEAAAEEEEPPAVAEAEPPEEPAEPSDDVVEAGDAEEDMADDMDAADMDDMADGDMADDAMGGDDIDTMDDAADEVADSASWARGGVAADEAEEPEARPQPEQPATTTFEDYERAGFVDTSTDAVSTFSLDTDRTSYFLALAWARAGFTVEPDSVRAEEWINAFDYAYAGPGNDSDFAITSNLVGHPLEVDWHVARVAFQAPELRDDVPLNVTLVLDASGSMSWGNRVAIAREAAETIRQSLRPRDRIAIVHFTTNVLDRYTVAHSTPDDNAVATSIANLAPHDSTNVQAGLNLGVELAAAARRERPDAYNYIILMSDGVANVDATDPFAILEGAPDTDSKNPLRLITIGVGIENYNDVLLEQLAQHGNGWYRYLDDTAQAQETFSRENWLALSSPFADQTRAQVTWDPAVVKAWRIVGYENRVTPDHTFTQNRREFAEIPSGTATTVLYELDLHDDAGASAVLGSVEVRWVDPATGASVSQTAAVTGRTDSRFGDGDRYLRLGVIVGLAADRYSALSPQVENAVVDYNGIHGDLSVLLREFDALQGQLGATRAYDDFRFLLEQLTAAAAERAPSSGYSQ